MTTKEILCYLVVSKNTDDDMPLSEYYKADAVNSAFRHASKIHAFSDCRNNLEYCYVLEVSEDKTVKYTYYISGRTEDELSYEFNKLRKLLYMTQFTLDWSHV